MAENVKNCEVCQRSKVSEQRPVGLIQPLPIPSPVWEDVPMDFIEGMPVSKGTSIIFVIVDRLSKYAHFVGLRIHSWL